jgi:hypothetical protein
LCIFWFKNVAPPGGLVPEDHDNQAGLFLDGVSFGFMFVLPMVDTCREKQVPPGKTIYKRPVGTPTFYRSEV